ncbi:chemotaxis protein CheW [Pseudothauera rhizosphaerae]|uniref:histidine kinase n=1 Tax=Pseudothauera rhizosphaerae TaxID=2565932 RepID=A0A4S4AMY8_9RHOO|nr:hypothetical protein E6O51_12130 [Pseudothauera rhizosphaerae]
MSGDMDQFYQVFFEETDELLAHMEALLPRIDPQAPAAEDVAELFRAVHSIKGGAATFGFDDITALARELEKLLDGVREGSRPLSRAVIGACGEAGGVLRNLLDAHRGQGQADDARAAELCGRLAELAASPDAGDGAPAPAPANPDYVYEAEDGSYTLFVPPVQVRGRVGDRNVPAAPEIGDGLVVAVGDERYVVPLGSVAEALLVAPQAVCRMGGRARMIRVRGDYLTVLDLAHLFAVPALSADWNAGVAVVVEVAGARAALGVDAVEDVQPLAIERIDASLCRPPAVAAATVLGSGEAVPVLDVAALLDAVRSGQAGADERAAAPADAGDAETGGKRGEDGTPRIEEVGVLFDALAVQANIVAVNAAVEAARAGGQGQGFARVAAEIRALAKRSALSAREVKELIAILLDEQAGGRSGAGGEASAAAPARGVAKLADRPAASSGRSARIAPLASTRSLAAVKKALQDEWEDS